MWTFGRSERGRVAFPGDVCVDFGEGRVSFGRRERGRVAFPGDVSVDFWEKGEGDWVSRNVLLDFVKWGLFGGCVSRGIYVLWEGERKGE